jgi:flavodoxin
MNISVKYHSTTGNTKKVAEAISEATGVVAGQISDNTTVEAADLLFIGDGIYAGKVNINTVNFIKTLNGDKVKNAAVFGTYGGQDKAIADMKELLKAQGINVIEDSFGCKGKAWFFFNRQHPDAQELANAKEFANNVVNKLK